MTSRLASRLAGLALVLSSTSGCSWAFMQKAPEPVLAPDYPVECTSSRAAPVLDTICTGYFGVEALIVGSIRTCDPSSFDVECIESGTKTAVLVSAIGIAALCAVSASSGYKVASQCQAVKGLNALCITGREDACRQLNSSWTPVSKVRAAPPPDVPAPGSPGCTKDLDCKGSRVCERGVCVEP